MNFFCRIFGHTWVPHAENPKIRWTASKNMTEMEMSAAAEPRLYLECARCKQRKDFDAASERLAS
jgi:hypothetical protein